MRISKDKIMLITLLLIPLALYTFFKLSLIPFGIYWSFTDKSFIGEKAVNWVFIRLQNYERLLTDPMFWESIKNSFIYAIVCGITGQFWLGLFLALLIFSGKKAGSRARASTVYILTSVAIASWILPETIAGFEWLAMYDRRHGLLNAIFATLGVEPIKWLDMKGGLLGIPMALYSLILANIWKGCSFSMVSFLSALEAIPGEIYYAAKVDGANKLQEIRYITLPLLKYIMPFVLLILFMGSFSHFAFVYIITGEKWITANVGIYSWATAFKYWEIGYGSSIAVMLMALYISLGIIRRVIRPEEFTGAVKR